MIKPEKNHWVTEKIIILKHQNYWNCIIVSSARHMAVGVSEVTLLMQLDLAAHL